MPSAFTDSVIIQAGQKFSIALEANPSTGYQWELSNPLDTRYLHLLASEYVPPSPPAPMGQSGYQLVTLYAFQPGTTSISLKYCRPWDAGDCPNFAFYIVIITSRRPN
jgi:inhibitor of cysteine peptidase